MAHIVYDARCRSVYLPTDVCLSETSPCRNFPVQHVACLTDRGELQALLLAADDFLVRRRIPARPGPADPAAPLGWSVIAGYPWFNDWGRDTAIALRGLTLATGRAEIGATVLRSFALYFQLANIAEQHHRLRRRRAYEHEGRIPRESFADAITRLEQAGVGPDELRRGADRVSVELVLTAHPAEATRLGVLRAHRRIAALLRELDDPELPRSPIWKKHAAMGRWATEMRQHVTRRRSGVFRKIAEHAP